MRTGFLAVLALGVLTASAVTAADLPPADERIAASAWTFDAGVYAFLPLSVQGTSTVNGGSVDLDLGPSEIFDLVQGAISGRAEAWRNSGSGDGSGFGFIFDGQYVNLGVNRENVGPSSGATVDVDVQQGIVDVMAGYRLPTVYFDQSSGQAVIFDIMAGGRYNYLRQKIDITPGLPPPFTANLGGDRHWISPVIGARANWILNDRWNFVLRGDLSGFGVSGEQLSWSVTGLAGYNFTEKTYVRFGYRAYGIDYSDGTGASEFAYDVTEHGPFIGIGRTF